jgi:MFS family permease
MIVAFAPIAGRLSDRVGPRWPMTTGLAIVTTALYWLTRIDVHTTYGNIWPSFVLMGFGMALVMSPMSTAAMNAVAEAKAGVASGILSMNRMVGGSLGVAVIGAVFQALAPAGTRDPSAFVHAFSDAMWVATAVAATGALMAAVLIRDHRVRRVTGADAEAAVTPAADLATGEHATV